MKTINVLMITMGMAGVLMAASPMSKEPTKDVQAGLDKVFPGWVTSENAPDLMPGLRLPPHANGAKVPSVMTHPLKGGFASLTREVAVPAECPRLVVSASSEPKGDWTFEAKVAGESICRQVVTHKSPLEIELPLRRWAGQKVKIELFNHASGWNWEDAYWHRIEIMSGRSGERVTMETLLNEMVDEEARTRLAATPVRARLWSSHNRKNVAPDKPGWYANSDCNQFDRVEKNGGRTEHVMADVLGPGAITRFWITMAGADGSGILRFYIDGKLAIEGPIMKLVSGGLLCAAPMSTSLSPKTPYLRRGHDLYLPIPYAEHLKVTYEYPKKKRREILYYNFETRSYPCSVEVESFTMDALTKYRAAIDRVNKSLVDGIALPDGSTTTFDGELAPGTSCVRELKGPGVIRALDLNAGTDAKTLRGLYLELIFDDERTVMMPVSAFYAICDKYAAYTTRYVSAGADGALAARWLMPFARTASVRVFNLGRKPVTLRGTRVLVAPYAWDAARSLHFGATWTENRGLYTGVNGQTDLRYCDLTGAGYVVSMAAAAHTHEDVGWWGEGDEKVYIDGEHVPSFIGTGTEDHYGFAWSNRNTFDHPLLAQPIGIGCYEIGVAQMLRHRMLDAIPFTRSIRYDMELVDWEERRPGRRKIDYSPTAWWYMRPGGTSLGNE